MITPARMLAFVIAQWNDRNTVLTHMEYQGLLHRIMGVISSSNSATVELGCEKAKAKIFGGYPELLARAHRCNWSTVTPLSSDTIQDLITVAMVAAFIEQLRISSGERNDLGKLLNSLGSSTDVVTKDEVATRLFLDTPELWDAFWEFDWAKVRTPDQSEYIVEHVLATTSV